MKVANTYHKVPLTLTQKQFHRLRLGHQVQLAHEQIAHGRKHRHFIHAHHETAKKVHKAAVHHKGVRIALSPDEFESSMHGGGFMDFLNNIKNGLQNAGNWVKNNVIDTPFYQNTIRPVVHDIVNSTVKPFVGKYTGPLSGVADKAIDAVGSASGAYGFHHKRKGGAVKKRKAPKKRMHHMSEEDKEYFEYLAPSPLMPRMVNAQPKGGSFMASGYGV